jgi:hypothetical protein
MRRHHSSDWTGALSKRDFRFDGGKGSHRQPCRLSWVRVSRALNQADDSLMLMKMVETLATVGGQKDQLIQKAGAIMSVKTGRTAY